MIARAFKKDPYTVLGRFCAILIGIALTWTCVIYGLVIAGSAGHLYRPGLKHARERVREVEHATTMYVIENDRCPRTVADLVVHKYIARRASMDPWGITISIKCSTDEWSASSAGPDRTFHTADDVTSRD